MVFKRQGAATEPVEAPITNQLEVRDPDLRALVAAAAQIQLDDGSVMRTPINDQEWQREAWRQYDLSGELRFAANRHAAALSKCRLVVSEVDELGRPGEETKDPKIAMLSETVFGSPAAKAEHLRTIGVQKYISGETYIVAEGATNPKSDVWYTATPAQIRKTGSRYKVKRPSTVGGGWHEIVKGKDLLIRSWTPHPRDYDVADSPTRAVLPILREIERLTLLTFSQIDSRLISAGLMLLPENVDFSGGDASKPGIKGLLSMIIDVATKQLTGAGTAAGLVPILGTIPAGTGGDVQHLKFETALQGELKEKLDHAIRRLATGLDISPEELLGQGDTNHWSAWQIDETGIKLFIEPVMTRICDALTVGYLHPALRAMGVKDVEKYTLWFDTSPLTVRPNRFEDAVLLYDKGELSADEMRKAGNFSDESAPKKKDLTTWRAWEVVKLDPALLQQEAYAKLLGLPVSEPPPPPAPPGMEGLPPGEDPAAARDAEIAAQMGLPATDSGGASPAQQGVTASAVLVFAAEQAVLRALEMAGARLLTGRGRGNLRGQFADIPRTELHTRVRPNDREHASTLLAGAFTHVPRLADAFGLPPDDLEYLLSGYCAELLVRGYAHETDLLRITLERGGAIRAAAAV